MRELTINAHLLAYYDVVDAMLIDGLSSEDIWNETTTDDYFSAENDYMLCCNDDGLQDDLNDYYYKHLFNFGEGLFDDISEYNDEPKYNELINLVSLLQYDNNVTEYNVEYY